jgi:hypothetical protein
VQVEVLVVQEQKQLLQNYNVPYNQNQYNDQHIMQDQMDKIGIIIINQIK